MSRYIISTCLGVLVLCCSVWGSDQGQHVTTMSDLGSMPLAFTENQGQWPDSILFRADASGAAIWFTADGVYYQFTRRVPGADTDLQDSPDRMHDRFDRERDSVETMMIKARFAGASPSATVKGEGLMEYECNYFIGNDPAKWRTNVPNYRQIVYEEIYPGIDLKYSGNGKQMEYNFIVSDGADTSLIDIQYEGANLTSVIDAGESIVDSHRGEVLQQLAIGHQVANGASKRQSAKCLSEGNEAVGVRSPDVCDVNRSRVVDFALIYSTYLGGGEGIGDDYGYGVAVDNEGSAYVTGLTESSDFPTLNPYQPSHSGGYDDVFITKLNSSGNSLVYSTYLGGSAVEAGLDIDVDASGAVYVTGFTYSVDFPTENPYQGSLLGTKDGFVVKLSSSGSDLIYSTYLGGSDNDNGYRIAVDTGGAAYVTGSTSSNDFPTENPYQASYQGGFDDGFVTKLSSTGNNLVYSTYIGGSSNDGCSGIVVDAEGSAYVSGKTYSSDFPTVNAYQTDQGGWDAFVAKFTSTGDALLFSTYLGGSDSESGGDVAVDPFGAVYVTGYTNSIDFPTENPYQGSFQGGPRDAFVSKLNSAGRSLDYSTYLGGSGEDHGYAIAVDAGGSVHVTGMTSSSDFPTVNAYQIDQGGRDAYVAKLSSTGNALPYSTYLGGSESDEGYAIAIDEVGAAFITGYTGSTDFPTMNAYQMHQGGDDAFVAKMYGPSTRGDVTVHLNGSLDELYIGDTNIIEFYIENDAMLLSMLMAFECDIGCNYQFDPNHGGPGKYFKEWNDAVGVFDLVSPVETAAVDGNTPDSILLVAGAMFVGLPANSSRLCYTMAVYIPPSESELADGSCIDNIFFPPLGDWQFGDAAGLYVPAFQGHYNSSETNPDAPAVCFDITQPTGACCDRDGGCSISSPEDCEALNHLYMGHTTTCDPSPCSPVGACCRDDGHCIQRTQWYCEDVLGRVYVGDGVSCDPNPCDTGCCNHDGMRGDENNDHAGPNIVDLTYLVAYLFGGGAPPPCEEEGDANADGAVNIVDLTLLTAYLFGGGSAPEPCP